MSRNTRIIESPDFFKVNGRLNYELKKGITLIGDVRYWELVEQLTMPRFMEIKTSSRRFD